jgi:hypothetical protein
MVLFPEVRQAWRTGNGQTAGCKVVGINFVVSL